MSDDERIERLTQLARRVWPDLEEPAVFTGDNFAAQLHDGGLEYIHVHPHPRALDAIEAALLALLEEGLPHEYACVRESRDLWCERADAADQRVRELEVALEDWRCSDAVKQLRLDEVDAWVEQLAAECEERGRVRDELAAEAARRGDTSDSGWMAMMASQLRDLAAELRARAKGSASSALAQVSGKPTYEELHAHYRDACRMLAEQRAWIEQLAADWEARSDSLADAEPELAYEAARCAVELRARAKGTSHE